jgi:predicted tellurium resistance membrane protein TerC
MIEWYEIQEQWPTLAAMAMIEVLLSVDNVVASAAIVSHLPPNQRPFALRLGVFAAYFLRVIALLKTAPIFSMYPAAKIVGALYMMHLAASHFTRSHTEDSKERESRWGFFKTVIVVICVDFLLTTDNIIAAVSMSKVVWVVCSSVLFGVVLVGIFGSFTVRIVRRFSVLGDSIYVLIGWIGILLLAETTTKSLQIAHLTDIQKFLALLEIILMTLIYDAMPSLQQRLNPVLKGVFLPILKVFNLPLTILFWPIRKITALAD